MWAMQMWWCAFFLFFFQDEVIVVVLVHASQILPFLLTIIRPMPFLHQQPCLLPCALCTSQCPPENIIHDIEQISSYYDPTSNYFPTCHPSLFDAEKSVIERTSYAFTLLFFMLCLSPRFMSSLPPFCCVDYITVLFYHN